MRFPLLIVNGSQSWENADQCCGFEEVVTKVTKPHMVFLQNCVVHHWFGAKVMPELLVVPYKRCGWLLNDVEDASQNQQVKQPCNDANQTIGLANITAKSVALYVCFRSVGMPTSDPYSC